MEEKLVNSLEELNKIVDFLECTLGANLFGSMIAGKAVIRAGEGVTTAG